MKLVCQLDAEGIYVGQTIADESPLEPGVYLIPGGAIDVLPPAIPDGQRARWSNGWQLEPIPEPAPNPEPPVAGGLDIPPDGVPRSVTRRQAKQALLIEGLLDQVQPAIDAIADPMQRALIQIEWDDSQDFERDRPALIALGAALGLDSTKLDELFKKAAIL